MTKRLRAKKEMRKSLRSNQTLSATMRKEYLPTVLMAALLLGSTLREPLKADDVGRGIFGGAATGALIGGIAGGGRGAGYGALAGAALGGITAAASDDSGSSRNDPYRQLDKEERKLRKLQDKFDKASDKKRVTLQRQLDTQRARVADLKNRLGAR